MLPRYFSWLTVAALSAASGSVYGLLFGTGHQLISVVHGIFIGTPVLAYERGLLFPSLGEVVRRSATPIYVVATSAVFLVCFAVGNALAALLLWSAGITRQPIVDAAVLDPTGLTFSITVAALIIAGFRVRDLIGPGTFVNLLVGRYHKPVWEDRVFLFIDLVDSTRFADRHGPLRTQEFLGAVFEALADPVRRYHGTIDDYVGDEAIVTWTIARGTKNAAAVACLFAFFEEIERSAASWRLRFEELPRFRAALHCGSVVTAEIGLDRHKITYFGEVVNTTSRLEALAKSLGQTVVLSTELLHRSGSLPPGILAEDLGLHAIRGRDEPLAVTSLRSRNLRLCSD